jgi:hypothetical protein
MTYGIYKLYSIYLHDMSIHWVFFKTGHRVLHANLLINYNTGWATITDSVGKKKFYIKFLRLWIVPISVCFIDIIDSWYTFQI